MVDITSAEVLDHARKVEKSGRRETARKLCGAISSIFRLAVVTLRAGPGLSAPSPVNLMLSALRRWLKNSPS
ncbi:MAG: phage integrase central domain-containing protein [Devosia sp.]